MPCKSVVVFPLFAAHREQGEQNRKKPAELLCAENEWKFGVGRGEMVVALLEKKYQRKSPKKGKQVFAVIS